MSYICDDWQNVHLDSTYRKMVLKRIDRQNELLEELIAEFRATHTVPRLTAKSTR